MITQLIIFVVTFLAFAFLYYLARKKGLDISNKVYRTLSLVLAGVFFFRFMLGRDALSNIFMLQNSPIDSTFLTVSSLLLNWALNSAVLLVVLYPFFSNSKLEALIKYYCLIVAALCLIFIKSVSMGIVGEDYNSVFNTRMFLLGIELAMLLSYSLLVFMEKGKFNVAKKDRFAFTWMLPMLFATMPPYILSAFFGHLNYTVVLKDFSFPHRWILYFSILIPFAIYMILRKKNKHDIRGALIYLSLGMLISFSIFRRFDSFTSVRGLPLHLCNTALYIIPLCLIFKWEKLFYFTYFINVFGAFLAMIMPNYADSANLLSTTTVEFYLSHYIAFFMPILIVMLGVYSRPRLKQFYYSMVGFAIYFTLVLILNAWFSNYQQVDYFFINSDFIADKLGKWATNLRKSTFEFNIGELQFLFYPIYQFLFFITYVALGAGVWFVYESMYSLEDTLIDIKGRKKQIKLDELALLSALNGRSKEEPMNKDAGTSIVLNNFSKRYGKSKTYAVKDANLHIVGGEIFGFLGHNGAGKSTIIKSVVGIQPITQGKIEVCGYDVDLQPEMAKKQIGYVPDHYALYEKLTGREFINYIANLYEVSQQDRDAAITKYVELFEMEGSFDNQIKTYSHGMKQKITIISALVHNPKVWILDEPLTGLDPHSIFQVKKCMKEHAKNGNIVFFSSHLIDVVEQTCDRIAIIKQGIILTSADLKEIQKTTTLEDFYLKLTKSPIEKVKVIKEEEKIAVDNNDNVKKSAKTVKTSTNKKGLKTNTGAKIKK